MKLIVFQHIACEHPGIFREFLARDGIAYDAVELDEGERIPDLRSYDALWVMGGPMDVWDVDQHPWLVEEKRAIRHWVQDLRKPFLGFCLGHQLLADALGGTCGPQSPAEIGILNIQMTQAGREDALFAGLAPQQACLQWHSVRVAQPPHGAEVLASSEMCPVQAMRIGDNAWSMQYHVEMENDTIMNWGRIPAYASALENTLGRDAISRLQDDAKPHIASMKHSAELIYKNFCHAVG